MVRGAIPEVLLKADCSSVRALVSWMARLMHLQMHNPST